MISEFNLTGENLSLIRGDRLLFKNLSFSVKNKDVLHIKGKNGTGKTSLLKTLCGLIELDSGSFSWNGQLIRRDFYDLYSKMIYLGHQFGVKQRMTVLENLLVYAKIRQQNQEKVIHVSDILQAIERVGLKGYEDIWVSQLSQGQTRRVNLARLLIEKVPLWILDEPWVALDIDGQQWLSKEVESHVERGGAVIFTSHQSVDLVPPVTQLSVGG